MIFYILFHRVFHNLWKSVVYNFFIVFCVEKYLKNPKNSLFIKKIFKFSFFPYLVENPRQILPKNEVFNRCFFFDTFWHQPQKVSKKDRLRWESVLFFLPKKFCLAKRTPLSPLKTLPSPPRRTFGAGRAQGVWFLKERGSRKSLVQRGLSLLNRLKR